MTNRFSKIIWPVLIAAFVVAGCEQGQKEETSVYEVLLDPNFAMPDYASGAIEATGGHQAWTKAKKIEFDCVVTFYQPDGSFYLTEQHHEIYPWLNSIRISATEPQGKFVWELSGRSFSVLKGAERVDALPIAVCERWLAEAILNITTAPVRFLDESVEFTKSSEPVKMEGRWYYPIEQDKIQMERYWSKVVFYQNKDSSLVDMLSLCSNQNVANGGIIWLQEFFAVRSYDYREIEKGGILVPTKIEIFATDAESVLRERLVKIDYYRLRVTE